MRFACVLLASLLACGDDDATTPPLDEDAGSSPAEDAGPLVPPDPTPVGTDHCTYGDMLPTANTGGTVTAEAVEAGAAETVLRLPIGTALGAYTARVDFLGDIEPPDRRFNEMSGTFVPSYGVETHPRAKALALTSGDETVVILKVDVALADDEITHRVTQALGESRGEPMGGKVLIATSHSHGAFAQYTHNSVLWVGLGRVREEVVESLVEQLVDVADEALDARVAAQIGVTHEPAFDPEDLVTRDRRPENDPLMGGPAKDTDLYVIRVDDMEGEPIALASVFGIHGTVLDADNLLATTDSVGAIERAVEESFDTPVVVMHLQGSGGDVSPAGSGGIQCEGDPCYDFARSEMVGRNARDWILTAWMEAEPSASIELEMVSQSIVLGPDWETFSVRDGGLVYAAWDGVTPADNTLYDGDAIASPIDEFNAPYGAALCGETNDALFPGAQIPGTRGVDGPYRSCLRLEVGAVVLGEFFLLPFEPMPSCATTRTTLSALRIGDFVFATAPGEPVTLWSERLRELAGMDGTELAIVGFAQDHMGYLMTPEDWLVQGYEPSINVWGPLEGEYVAQRLAEVIALARTDEREDAAAMGATRYDALPIDDTDLPEVAPAPRAGTTEDVPWDRQYQRSGEPLASGQPPAQIERLRSATFAWIGEDPRAGTPMLRLEREVGEDSWEPVVRRSGRPVLDQDLLLIHTPDPLIPGRDDPPRTHRYLAEWQAVTPWSADLEGVDDSVAARAGLPLGRYRIHVEGTGYEVTSDPIEVVAATLLLEAELDGTSFSGTARYDATGGFRLVHETLPSNLPVPVRGSGELEVVTADGTETLSASFAEDGSFEVTVPEGVTSIVVRDAWGNAATFTP